MTVDEAVERVSTRVREQIDVELTRAKADLVDAQRRLEAAISEHAAAAKAEQKAWARYEPHDGQADAHEQPTHAAWLEASATYDRAGKTLLGVHDRVRYLERLIESLTDPATVEARIGKRVDAERRLAPLRERSDRASTDATSRASVGGRSAGINRPPDEGGTMARTATQNSRARGSKPQGDEGSNGEGSSGSTSRSSVPQEIIDRIVKQIGKEGLGLSTVAKKLNDDGVPTAGKSAEWTPQYVRTLYLKATGLKGVKQARAKVPLKRTSAGKPASEGESEKEPAAAAS